MDRYIFLNVFYRLIKHSVIIDFHLCNLWNSYLVEHILEEVEEHGPLVALRGVLQEALSMGPAGWTCR